MCSVNLCHIANSKIDFVLTLGGMAFRDFSKSLNKIGLRSLVLMVRIVYPFGRSLRGAVAASLTRAVISEEL